MENLRWILLAAGIFFILAIYFAGRQRRRRNSSDLFDSKEDLPEITARDWDELDEGVGKVRIIARADDDDDFSGDVSIDSFNQYDAPPEIEELAPECEEAELTPQTGADLFEQEEQSAVDDSDSKPESASSNVDIIVLYILAKPSDLLAGDKINSVAQANGMTFGSMDIFHRLDGDGKTIFSLANMVEPGNFDPDSIHEMTTTGLTLFMQLSNLSTPSDDFDEMLRCAYHMSEMLGAVLCNHRRQPITQADAENYRNIISEKENQ